MFDARRKALFAQLPNLSAVLMQSASVKLRNHDTEYPYRQESYFYYLTGIQQADVTLLFVKRDGKESFHVFCDDTNLEKERWIGRQMSHASAKSQYGATEVHLLQALDEKLLELLSGLSSIYFFLDDMTLQRKMSGIYRKLKNKARQGEATPEAFQELSMLLGPMRLIKSDVELERMQKAATISVEAHNRVMQLCKPGMYEYELEAELLRTFYAHGSRYPAYTSIVAGGANACVLHYVDNRDILRSGDLVLIDAGAEYDYYASDITRTFPVNGQFSGPQRAIYEIVLNAQLAGIRCIKPGVCFEAIQAAIVKEIVRGLISLKIFEMNEQEAIETKAYQRYYMHKSGHWLGMDVHDVGPYHLNGQSIPLAVNQVLTVEPGLYFDPAYQEVPEIYRGIGIRIEDDVVVGDKEPVVLSQGVPKSITDIEKLMA
ncbi:MAG: aminopeptidase P N-terminal domain-containing protein [Gammaproteobacteria bacterium]